MQHQLAPCSPPLSSILTNSSSSSYLFHRLLALLIVSAPPPSTPHPLHTTSLTSSSYSSPLCIRYPAPPPLFICLLHLLLLFHLLPILPIPLSWRHTQKVGLTHYFSPIERQ